ncbi:MAG: hypothetical protein ACREJX_03055 [Polyangiaceae bacterium]
MNDAAPRKTRITRAEAAKLLGTSYQNVRRLQRTGQLQSNPDRYGVHRFDRREVEALARRRGLRIRPSGELAARVFAMFKERQRFEDIVIETQQEPDIILGLWKRYRAGFGDATGVEQHDEGRVQQTHDEAMRAIDAEIERRRAGFAE